MYDLLNGLEPNERDNTFIEGSKCIDFVLVTSSVIKFIKGCELINYDQIIETDHQGYLFDINLEQYFEMNQFDVDKVKTS